MLLIYMRDLHSGQHPIGRAIEPGAARWQDFVREPRAKASERDDDGRASALQHLAALHTAASALSPPPRPVLTLNPKEAPAWAADEARLVRVAANASADNFWEAALLDFAAFGFYKAARHAPFSLTAILTVRRPDVDIAALVRRRKQPLRPTLAS